MSKLERHEAGIVVRRLKDMATTQAGVFMLITGSFRPHGTSGSYNAVLASYARLLDIELSIDMQMVSLRAVLRDCIKKKDPVPASNREEATLLIESAKGGEEGADAARKLRSLMFVKAQGIIDVQDRTVQNNYRSYSAQDGPLNIDREDIGQRKNEDATVAPGGGLYREYARARSGVSYYRNSIPKWHELARIRMGLLGNKNAPSVGGSCGQPYGVVGTTDDGLACSLLEYIVLVGRDAEPEYSRVVLREGPRRLGRDGGVTYCLHGKHTGLRIPESAVCVTRKDGSKHVVDLGNVNTLLQETGTARLFSTPRVLDMLQYTFFTVALTDKATGAFVSAFYRVATDLLRLQDHFARVNKTFLAADTVIWLTHTLQACEGSSVLVAATMIGSAILPESTDVDPETTTTVNNGKMAGKIKNKSNQAQAPPVSGEPGVFGEEDMVR